MKKWCRFIFHHQISDCRLKNGVTGQQDRRAGEWCEKSRMLDPNCLAQELHEGGYEHKARNSRR
jgi:hypothetical protein